MRCDHSKIAVEMNLLLKYNNSSDKREFYDDYSTVLPLHYKCVRNSFCFLCIFPKILLFHLEMMSDYKK